MPVALITGVTGQDGSYLCELLLEKGYQVHGMCRNPPAHSGDSPITFHKADLIDSERLNELILEVSLQFQVLYLMLANCLVQIMPDEVYNLAAQANPSASFSCAEYTGNVDALGTVRLLEAIRSAGLIKSCRFFQASSSELFGAVEVQPQCESTPFHPRSPYGVAKLYAYWIVVNYREVYGMHAVNGILFNHESPRRGLSYLTRKVTHSVASISVGLQDSLQVGNLDAKRDWGHARDYVEAMWMTLQADAADDFIIATGQSHSVRWFIERAFTAAGIMVSWSGSGADEIGTDQNGKVVVRVDPAFFRPPEPVDVWLFSVLLNSLMIVLQLVGDSSKIRERLGWSPKTSLCNLVEEMVRSDLELVTSKLSST